MRSRLLVAALAFAAGTFIAPALADPSATATPASAPTTAPTPMPSAGPQSFALEGGYSNDSLSNNSPSWNAQYLTALLGGPHEANGYVTISNNNRFGETDSNFEGGINIPTGTPNGTITISDAFSPTHNFLPTSNFSLGFDNRDGGGYGYQIGYNARGYELPATATAQALSLTSSSETLGGDRYFGDSRLGLDVSFSQLKNYSGTAAAFTGKWGIYTSTDSFNASGTLGKDVEESGIGTIAVYDVAGLDLDDLHWTSKNTAIHAGVGYYNLTGAYGRFEVRLGLRQRL